MSFEDLKNPELQEKLRNAQTPEELVALARAEGVELSDEQLEAISGGKWGCDHDGCPDYSCKKLCWKHNCL